MPGAGIWGRNSTVCSANRKEANMAGTEGQNSKRCVGEVRKGFNYHRIKMAEEQVGFISAGQVLWLKHKS